jgi:hypothetical protein
MSKKNSDKIILCSSAVYVVSPPKQCGGSVSAGLTVR